MEPQGIVAPVPAGIAGTDGPGPLDSTRLLYALDVSDIGPTIDTGAASFIMNRVACPVAVAALRG
jgi:hypothetical protein